MAKTVLFFNPFDDFTCNWANEPFTVLKNQKVYMQDYLAEHIAKHLVDRELNNLRLPTDFESADTKNPNFANSRSKLLAQVLIASDENKVHSSEVKQELDLINKKEDGKFSSELSKKV